MARGAKNIGSSSGQKKTLNRAGTKKRTSIGASNMTSPKNKHTRANFKVYRGQGR